VIWKGNHIEAETRRLRVFDTEPDHGDLGGREEGGEMKDSRNNRNSGKRNDAVMETLASLLIPDSSSFSIPDSAFLLRGLRLPSVPSVVLFSCGPLKEVAHG
jgi:hypothetical protein